MALIEPVSSDHGVQWPNIRVTDTARPVVLPEGLDREVQVSGTFGGAVLSLQGSLESGVLAAFITLRSPDNARLNFSAGDIRYILENTVQVLPLLVGGDGTTDLTVTVYILGLTR